MKKKKIKNKKQEYIYIPENIKITSIEEALNNDGRENLECKLFLNQEKVMFKDGDKSFEVSMELIVAIVKVLDENDQFIKSVFGIAR